MADSSRKDRRNTEDESLGMTCPISRRDFLNSTLLASGGLLMGGMTPLELLAADSDWNGFGGVGDYGHSNGNTFEVLTAGHTIRDHQYEQLPATIADTGETYDCVVIGAGVRLPPKSLPLFETVINAVRTAAPNRTERTWRRS